jgi:hypothetical protein
MELKSSTPSHLREYETILYERCDKNKDVGAKNLDQGLVSSFVFGID